MKKTDQRYLNVWPHKISHIFAVFETERQRDREIERQRDRETERQRDRETERQRDRERQKNRETETERQRQTLFIWQFETKVT